MKTSSLWLFGVLLALPNMANAHLVSTRFGEFYSGLLHPTTSLIHVLPWFTLGLLAAFQPLSQARKLLVLFPLAVLFGALCAGFSVPSSIVDGINLASIVVIGLCIVIARRLPAYMLFGVATLFGFTHGLANANIDLMGTDLILYLAGMTVAAYLMVCLSSGMGVWLLEKYSWGKTTIRAAGGWVLAIGIMFGGFTLLNLSA